MREGYTSWNWTELVDYQDLVSLDQVGSENQYGTCEVWIRPAFIYITKYRERLMEIP